MRTESCMCGTAGVAMLLSVSMCSFTSRLYQTKESQPSISWIRGSVQIVLTEILHLAECCCHMPSKQCFNVIKT